MSCWHWLARTVARNGAVVMSRIQAPAGGELHGCCCGSHAESWSPAFAAWLCEDCRQLRTEAELRATEAANLAAGRTAASDI